MKPTMQMQLHTNVRPPGSSSGMERAAGQQRGHEEGGGRMGRVVAAGRRGQQAGGGGMERVAVGAWRGWVDGVGVSVGGQHVGCEIRTGMGIGSVGA